MKTVQALGTMGMGIAIIGMAMFGYHSWHLSGCLMAWLGVLGVLVVICT